MVVHVRRGCAGLALTAPQFNDLGSSADLLQVRWPSLCAVCSVQCMREGAGRLAVHCRRASHMCGEVRIATSGR